MNKYQEAINVLQKAADGERMKATIAPTGSLGKSYYTNVAVNLEAAIQALEQAN